MFDSVPPNLPVEPVPSAPTAPAVPAAPATEIMGSTRGKKEPEDIFSGLEQSSANPTNDEPLSVSGSPRGRSGLRIALIVVVALVVLAGIGITVWLLFFTTSEIKVSAPQVSTSTGQVSPAAPEKVEQPPLVETPSVPVTQPPNGVNVPVPVPIQTPTTPVENPTTTVTSTASITEGVDTDADGLSDVEEPYYQADLSQADTDHDGYADGSEIVNLFSPASPGKRLDAESFMQKQQWNGWSFILPKPWTVIADASRPEVATVTTGGATRFTLEVKPNSQREPLDVWVRGSLVTAQLRSFQTKSGLAAMQSQDGLTTYLAAGDMVLVVTYDLNGDPSYNFRASYNMLVNALVAPSEKK